MNKIVVYIVFSLISVLTYSQATEPVIDTSFTVGGIGEDRLYKARELDNRQVLLAGETNSTISGDLTDLNEGETDLWVVKHDSANVFGNVWNFTYGGDSVELFGDIELVADGFVLLGSSRSPISGEKTQDTIGGMDYWLVRCDLNGNVLWERTYGGEGQDTATSVVALGDSGFLIGGYSNSENNGDKSEVSRGGTDYWVVRLDIEGNVLWDKTIGSDGDDILADIYYRNETFLCLGSSSAGAFGEKSEENYGESDFWLVSLDLDGNVMWDRSYGGGLNDFGREIAVQANNQLVIAGSSESPAGGTKTSINRGGLDMWLIQIDSIGDVVWDESYGGDDFDEFKDMYPTPQGGLVLGGTTNSEESGNKTTPGRGGFDYWLVSVDTLGDKWWDFTYGGSSDDILTSVDQGCDRGFLIGGYSESNTGSEKLQDRIGVNDYWFIRTLLPTRPRFSFGDVCYGTTVDFYDESDIWPDSWLWDFGDPLSGNNTSIDQHPQHSFSSPGQFAITLFVQEGCQQDTFFVDTINIVENYVLGQINLGPDASLCEGAVFLDAGDQEPGTTYLWSTGETSRQIVVDTVGTVSCTIRNDICTETDYVEFDHCPEVVLPTIFSPNGDNINDVFMPGFMLGVREMELYIYDRWGQLIYNTNEVNKGWDGRGSNGKVVQIGLYPYVLRYRGLGTEWYEINGKHVTVIR